MQRGCSHKNAGTLQVSALAQANPMAEAGCCNAGSFSDQHSAMSRTLSTQAAQLTQTQLNHNLLLKQLVSPLRSSQSLRNPTRGSSKLSRALQSA